MIKTRLVGLLSHAKKYIVYTILWQWAALLSQVLAVFSIAALLERVVYGTVTAAVLERTIVILFLVVVMRFICERMGTRSSYLACVDVKRILREKIYEKMLRLGTSYSEQVSSSEVVQVSTEGVEQLETYFGKYLPQLFYSLIAPLTLFVILCRVSLKASIILLICVPLIPISIIVVQKIAKKLLNKYWSIYTGLGDSFLENLQGLTTLKIYQADQQKADEMDVESQNFRSITMKVLTMQLNSTSVMDIVAYGGAAIGMAVAVSEFLKGNIDVAGTLCIVEEISGDVEPAEEKNVDWSFTGAEAKNVTFAYENETILDHYSLKLQPGKITGIHGVSGSGKSTLLKLLMRFWDVQDGSVAVDGADVREIPTRHLRDMESYVTQETHLFHDSIANNIALAKPGATREEIMEAAKKASIHDFIMTLPKGYDTKVGELGDTLSGGEKQRIGIARAFLHDAPMILMDEPTSNLDSLNEGIILKSLKESARKKTIVLVSHRVSTMNVADVVYEMENGRIS